MFPVRALFREIYRDGLCKLCAAVSKILLTRNISFPRQIIFNYFGQLYIFFDGSLQGYGACVYIRSHDKFNLIYSSCKVLGRSDFSAPQSEITGAVLATRMQQKIRQELFNVSLSPPLFMVLSTR